MLHSDLPIHRTGVKLLSLAIKAQAQMPRAVKRSLGEKITQHCVDMLDLMALADGPTPAAPSAPPPQGGAPGGPAKPVPRRPLDRTRRAVLHSRRPRSSGIGFGSPMESAATSRTVTAAAFSCLDRFWRPGREPARAAGFRSAGSPVFQPVWAAATFGSEATVVDRPEPRRPFMAHVFTAREERIVQRARALLERPLREPTLPAFDRLDAVRDYLRLRFAGLDHEQAHALYLNAQHVLIAAEVVSIGTLSQCPVYPREVARRALFHNAAAVVLAHNHPSGLATPSPADQHLSAALTGALRFIDVRLLDHVVVSGNVLCSAAERGLL